GAHMLRRLVLSLRYTFRRHAPRVPQRQVGVIPYAVVDGQVAVLLVTSRRTGRWIFPKGGLIDGLTPAEAAAREAFEEAGVEGEIESVPLGAYRSFKRRGLRPLPIEVDLYPLRVATQHEEWPEKKQRRRHWATVAEARKLLSEPQLAGLATMLRQRL
ncbi:MAG: NUDIX hydrolase, partial [Parvibaculum sp.]|nr:NUDIX hydrolase [Parvibaculum sp.]